MMAPPFKLDKSTDCLLHALQPLLGETRPMLLHLLLLLLPSLLLCSRQRRTSARSRDWQ
jgi:hypothetical protein